MQTLLKVKFKAENFRFRNSVINIDCSLLVNPSSVGFFTVNSCSV